MDYLWSPWRFRYIREASAKPPDAGCIFCRAPEAPDPAEALVLGRSTRCYAILNLYPYTSGHLMIVPYHHVAKLSDLDAESAADMMELAKIAERALGEVYRPDGVNIGMNLGKAAGAGIAEHIHLHVLPRWFGDANFLTVTGETRVLPEDLSTTYQKLSPHFDRSEP